MTLRAFVFLLLVALPTWAQPAEPDTLHLDALRVAAARQDPRAIQPDLLARATQLRLEALRSGRLPQFAMSGQATLQNEVPEIPINVPGFDVPSPPLEQFRAQIEANWTVYDGGRISRQAAAERARLSEHVAGVAVALYQLREATTEAFFGALLAGAQAEVLGLTLEDLDARLRSIRQAADAGAMLAADAAELEAERIRIDQQVEEAKAVRQAALEVLAELSGFDLSPSTVLALPDLDAETARVLTLPDTGLAGRPELVRFEQTARRAEAEARVLESQTRPSLSVFGQVGVGRPSPLNFLNEDLSEYAVAGVRVQWSPFDWGRARREGEALRLQARVAETEAEAFVRRLVREVEDERVDLARLDAAIAADERAVTLREEVLRVTQRQLDEGVILADRYTDRLTDLAEARLTLERHRLERARTQARLLSTLGHLPE